MKDIRFGIRVVSLIMASLILFVCAAYIVTIHVNGDRWINRANNTRLADAKKTTVQGSIFDSSGVLLAGSSEPGERHYIADTDMRRALSHTIGEQTIMSSTGVENFHSSTLLGFSTTRTGYTLQRLAGQDPIGNDIHLTVSAELTKYAMSVFPQWNNGAIVVINYKTGAILCMVSMPNFDPANMGQAVQDTAYYNRVVQKRYAPGSTFKIITLASALENLPETQNEAFSCMGVWNSNTFSLKCAGTTAHGDMTLKQAFAKSCNITFATIAYRLGADQMRETAENFGFNYEFIFPDTILNESRCLKKGSKPTDAIQAGIGQGTVEVTPLHMAMIAGSIANGGVMMEPKLIKKVVSATGYVMREMEPVVFKNSLSPENAVLIAEYMYDTVRGGTATRAAISGYKDGYVCGKTGSAEWTDDETKETNAWYTGFLYGDDAHPYAIAVVVEEGGSGGSTAAPIASKVLKKAIELGLY